MKNAWFALLLLASILINAAIVDSARLAPVTAPASHAAWVAPVIEVRREAPPSRGEGESEGKLLRDGQTALLGDPVRPRTSAIGRGGDWLPCGMPVRSPCVSATQDRRSRSRASSQVDTRKCGSLRRSRARAHTEASQHRPGSCED
jgi:hypothetical protein